MTLSSGRPGAITVGEGRAQPDITISIVNTNNLQVVLACLASIYRTADGLDLEIIVVNNACQDGSRAAIQRAYPQVKTIDHDQMLGFSTNNNLALAQARGQFLMLLNDDTIVQPGAFQALLAFARAHPDVGVTGGAMLNPDGSLQKSFDYSPNPFFDGLQPISEWLFPLPASRGAPMEVANVCGACMMVRAAAARSVGLLDTRFDPLYSEEVDWCFRIHQAGWKIYHLPAARVIHLGGSTMNRAPVRRYERIFEKKALFFRKHYGTATARLYKLLLFLMNLVKSAGWAVLLLLGKERARDELKTHLHMVRRALFL